MLFKQKKGFFISMCEKAVKLFFRENPDFHVEQG
jgi:hypothetical protein